MKSLPDIQKQSYELAYKLACEKLASLDIKQQCLRSDTRYLDPSKVIIEYLGQQYVINLPSMEISLPGQSSKQSPTEIPRLNSEQAPQISHVREGTEEIPLRERILMLHYLTLAKGTPISNRLVAFRQLPGGTSYFTAFTQRAEMFLLRHFGKEPELLMDAAKKMAGHKADYGDVAVCIKAFPRVPITIVLWRGDVEFAPRGSILFDSTVSDYLATEDICVICETIVRKLVNLSQGRQ